MNCFLFSRSLILDSHGVFGMCSILLGYHMVWLFAGRRVVECNCPTVME